MSEGELSRPEPAAKSTEKVEKNAIKSGESDSDLSWNPKPINTFDDIQSAPKKGISTFDDLVGKKDKNEINTFDDLRKEKNSSDIENVGKREKELDAEFVESVEKSKLEIDDKVNFLLTKGGLKPASVMELPIKLKTQEEYKEFFKDEDIENIVELVKKSGLKYHIGGRKIVEGSYHTKNDPEVEKHSKGEKMEIFIASSKENLDLLTKSWGTTDQEAIGKALGFPPTAAEAFVGKRENWFNEDIPDKIRESEAITFLTPTLSKDNWQEEIKEGEKRAEFIKRNSPEIYKAEMRIETGHRKWDKTEKELENTADSLGFEIDEGIKDPVVALNAFGINTGQSCEGHLDSGMSAPWIRITAPNEPEERFNGWNETFSKVAKKYNMPVEEAKRMFNIDAYWEAFHKCEKNGETKDYQKWTEETGKLLYTTKDILDDFYKNRQVPDNVKIKLDTESLADMAGGSFEVLNGGEDQRNINGVELSDEEKESLGKRLDGYRKEMQTFAEFLKDKLLNEGEDYVNSKKDKAQEKVDQEKINKIMEALGATEAKAYVKENLKDFENVEIKKISELPYWNKISKFLADKKIVDREVVIVDDNEKWKSIYGSNDSKSSHKPMAIILKKEIFEDEHISDENVSWLIHEIGHAEFYKSLGDKLDEYMEEYHAKGEYTNSEMERDAFRLQFEFLKSIGKTKEECLDFVEKYLDKSFGEDDKEAKEKELEQVEKYLDSVF